MANCTNCGAQLDAGVKFCPVCGTSAADFGAQNQGAQNQSQNQYQYQANAAPAQPAAMAYDHTSEFDAKDISDNKVIAMLGYIMGALGIIIQLLASSSSPYVKFHMRQALKITVVNFLMGIITALLFWTFIVPIAAGVMYIIFFVISIICFFQVCSGKAIEPAIIRSLKFFK